MHFDSCAKMDRVSPPMNQPAFPLVALLLRNIDCLRFERTTVRGLQHSPDCCPAKASVRNFPVFILMNQPDFGLVALLL